MKKLLIALIASCAYAVYANTPEDHDDHDHDAHEHAHEHHDDHENEHHEHEHAHDHGEERGVEVSEAAAKLIGLTTVRSESRVLDSVITIPARVVQNPKAARVVSARMGGFVTYSVSAPVALEAKTKLFEFVAPEAAAKYGELQALESRAAALAAAGAKNAQLMTDLSIARITYAAQTNGLEVLSAAAGRFAQLMPCAGRIDAFEVPSGSYVERGATLARLTENLPPAVLARMPVGEAVDLTDGLSASVADAKGTIRVDRTKNDGLVDVWFVFATDAKPSVRLGESVRLEIRTPVPGEPVVAVPSAALFRDGITPTVLVRDEDDEDRFITKAVTPGRSAHGWTEVKDLEAGTEVVVKGVYELRQALPSAGEKKAAGHFHADGKFHAGGHDDED